MADAETSNSDYIFISRRLVTKLVQESTKDARIEREANPTVGPLRVAFKMRPIDWKNYYELAERATEFVADNTGQLDRSGHPGRVPTGRYVKARMYLQDAAIHLPSWEDNHNHPIASFVGLERLRDIRVFVGLIGSESNYIHTWTGQDSRSTARRVPSDALGLYEIIQEHRELSDPNVSAYSLRREAALFKSEEEKFQEALNLFTACALDAPSQYLETLFEVHYRRDRYELRLDGTDHRRMGFCDLVLIGAPVWVRKAKDVRPPDTGPDHDGAVLELRPVRKIVDPIAANVDRLMPMSTHAKSPLADSPELIEIVDPGLRMTPAWFRFDGYVEAALMALALRTTARLEDWPPITEGDWTEYCEWFADQAVRIGPNLIPFTVWTRRWKLSGFRYEWGGPVLNSGSYGWFVPESLGVDAGHQDDALSAGGWMILTDGRCVEATGDGNVAGLKDPVYVEVGDRNLERITLAMLRTVLRWRTPMDPRAANRLQIED